MGKDSHVLDAQFFVSVLFVFRHLALVFSLLLLKIVIAQRGLYIKNTARPADEFGWPGGIRTLMVDLVSGGYPVNMRDFSRLVRVDFPGDQAVGQEGRALFAFFKWTVGDVPAGGVAEEFLDRCNGDPVPVDHLAQAFDPLDVL
jgi:hypothetical protein